MSNIKISSNQKKIESEIKNIAIIRSDIKKRISGLNKQLSGYDAEITKLQILLNQISIEPTVSEHAVLRYAERVLCVDIKKIKKEILTDKVLECINFMGSGKVKLACGKTAIIKNKNVITIE